ncbi:MAG: VCBS domain-containing protein [Comamonadaceae bacterium]|nr:VCBS domain-containing protein [Comamonadaceae bacterium]
MTITGTPTEGRTLSVGTLTDGDGVTGTPSYQWQVSSDGGTTWQDIAGARGQGSTLTLAESEAGRDVRLQVLYNDDGGVAEAPVSGSVSVANVDTAGSVTVSGILTPGETLSASIADGDGVTGAQPTYQWYRDGAAIGGATYSSYTLTNADGGAHMRVDVSFADDHGTTENRSFTTAGLVQLGIVAPVAANDTGSATEASGVGNNVPGVNPSGNLLGNDSDANNNIDATTPILAVRSGGVEGVGEIATLSGNTYTVAGLYGTLTVDRTTGTWNYVVDQAHPDVEALFTGDTLQDSFNYTLGDDTGLSDTAVLAVTINGANDSPTLNDVPPLAEFTEDIAAAIRTSFALIDPDGGSGDFSLRLTVTQGSLRGQQLDATPGVTVTGTDTSALTISAASMSAVQAWLNNNNLLYTSAPNENGNLNATLTYSVSDDGGSTFRAAGTTALNVAQANNPPVVDLGGSGSAGNNHTATFRPRGGEVAIVADGIAITDIDPADTLRSATVSLTTGAYDNEFGTLYETLRSTAGSYYTGSLGEIAITGNGTTQLVLTGPGTHADYQARAAHRRLQQHQPERVLRRPPDHLLGERRRQCRLEHRIVRHRAAEQHHRGRPAHLPQRQRHRLHRRSGDRQPALRRQRPARRPRAGRVARVLGRGRAGDHRHAGRPGRRDDHGRRAVDAGHRHERRRDRRA